MALSTLVDLRAEFAARGFDYIPAARATTWCNQSYLELCEEDNWPFLLTTATGAAPLTVPDLRTVKSVVDTATKMTLEHIDEETLRDFDPDATLSQTGTPVWYWVDAGSVVNAYPVGGTLSVRYWRVPSELGQDSDVPVVPQRFRNLIVDGMARRAYLDSDNPYGVSDVENERQQGLALMRRSLLWQDSSNSQLIVAGAEDW